MAEKALDHVVKSREWRARGVPAVPGPAKRGLRWGEASGEFWRRKRGLVSHQLYRAFATEVGDDSNVIRRWRSPHAGLVGCDGRVEFSRWLCRADLAQKSPTPPLTRYCDRRAVKARGCAPSHVVDQQHVGWPLPVRPVAADCGLAPRDVS